MKAKWIIPVLLLLFFIAAIRFPVAETFAFAIAVEGDSLHIKCDNVDVKSSGKLLITNMNIVFREDTLRAEEIVVRSSLFNLLQLKGEIDELVELAEGNQLFELQKKIASRCKRIQTESLSGNIRGLSFNNARIKIMSKGKHLRGAAKLPGFALWGQEHDKGEIQFRFRKNEVNGKLDCDMAKGSLKGSIAGELGETNSLTYEVRGKNLHFQNLFPEMLEGVCSFKYSGAVDSSKLLSGSGAVNISNFRDNHSQILGRLRGTLSYVGVDSIQFGSVSGDFYIDSSHIVSENIRAEGEMFSLFAAGEYGIPSQKYAYNVIGYLPESAEKTVSSVVWDGLLPDSTGDGRIFHGTLRGKGTAYSVSVDQKIIKRSVKSFFRGLFNN